MKSKSNTLKIIVFVALVLLTCIYLLPIYVMITNSLKTLPEIQQRTYLAFPVVPQFQNYRTALFGSRDFLIPMQRPIINSTIITLAVTLLATFFGGLGGYYLSRSRSSFVRVLFILVGIALYLPYQAVIIPLTTITAKSGLANSHLGLILSYLIINVPLASVLMGTFFLGIPRELEEAGQMDGASKVQLFFKVVSPISFPAYASVAIIIFTQVWNEFFISLTLSNPKTQTAQVAMAMTQGSTISPYNLQMAASLLTVAVPLVIFLFLGRYFIRGILAGALKG
ncbi:MAG: carbohydrate ABC transporter permease [Anaerolineales bacterium]|nr:carbohydrate ABC transporter permease [Anaerolineales bacterium]MDD5466287.1 carbohydrate ABC transporter permease [Anaerolineales bacterium]